MLDFDFYNFIELFPLALNIIKNDGDLPKKIGQVYLGQFVMCNQALVREHREYLSQIKKMISFDKDEQNKELISLFESIVLDVSLNKKVEKTKQKIKI